MAYGYKSYECEIMAVKVKLETNKMFRTFKTQKELSDYIEQHIPEEKRLLWLGAMFGMNYVAHHINETFDLRAKEKK